MTIIENIYLGDERKTLFEIISDQENIFSWKKLIFLLKVMNEWTINYFI